MTFPTNAPVGPPNLNWAFPESTSLLLDNGLRVVMLQKSRLPMVQVRLMIPGGRRQEAAGVKPGVTGLAMRCARYGTRDYSSSELALALDSLGTQVSCGASLDALSYSMQCLSENLVESLALFAQVVRFPLYNPSEVAREKTKLAAAKRQAAGSPTGTSGLWMGRLLYGNHPYGSPTASPDEIQDISADDLKRYHSESVRPSGAVLVLVGDFESDRVRHLLSAPFGDWSGEAPPCTEPDESAGPVGQSIMLLDRKASKQAHVLLGLSAVHRGHSDHLSLSCLNPIFGGGASGRLFKDLRETRSLTYGCSSSLDSGAWGGDLVAGMSCSTPNTEEAVSALLDQMQRICETPVSQEELDACIRYKVGAWPKAGSTLGGLSSLLMTQELHKLPPSVWREYPESLRKMSVAKLKTCAEKHLSYENHTLILVGDGEALVPILQQLGRYTVIPVDERPPRMG